jgi:hypothetical protein
MDRNRNREDANRDPLTGEPGSHPVATGVGAAGAAAAGAAVGAVVGGPVGAVVGGAVGAMAGGAAGHAAGEAIDPTLESEYWKKNFRDRPYYQGDRTFDDYEPAYRYGWESATQSDYTGRRFDEVESDLERGWDKTKGTSRHAWQEVREATRDAWDRVRS